VDVLVEFDRNANVCMITLCGIEIELGELPGRKVDLNTADFISKYVRNQVMAEAEDQYVAA
jgi:predicted nucleotidyltransferase